MKPQLRIDLLVKNIKGVNVLLFHVNPQARHGGTSGSFSCVEEVPLEYAFFLSLQEIAS
jgi:oligopeptidase B